MSSLTTFTSLLKAMKNGKDPKSWDEFQKRYESWIKGKIWHFLSTRSARPNSQEVDTLTSDIISRIWERFHTFDPSKRGGPGWFRAWLSKVIQNAVTDAVKMRRADRPTGGDDWMTALEQLPANEGLPGAVDEHIVQAVWDEVLASYLDECSEWQSYVLRKLLDSLFGLRHGNEKAPDGTKRPPLSDIAAEIGVKESTISSFLATARNELKGRFEEAIQRLDE